MSSLQRTLSKIRAEAKNDVEMGFAFEKLAKLFFENDATQTQQYSKVWHFSEWAKQRKEYLNNDIGIDLVAKLREEEGYCAIQCKFYQHDHSISKADLDSFISASSTSDFTRLVLIDTSSQPIGKNAQKVFDNLTKEYIRIQFSEISQSRIDWFSYIENGSINLIKKKELRDHQIQALKEVKEGLEKEDRGKMIMACGTGKTFTSLKIAEELGGSGKMVLYMVPSLALMSQTIREWKNDANEEFLAFSACSDQKVGKKKTSDDQIKINLNELAFPATTDACKLSQKIKNADESKMKVIFSTYQSIDVISKSQKEYGLKEFDLIICDEAHRTTGATLVGDDESNFVRIHKNESIRGKKRLYMTATPRIYGEIAKRRQEEGEVNLASMDDENIYGKTLFYRSFGWAVENNLLTDYKVVVLMMDEQLVSNRIQRSFSEGSELELDDATKMVGCYKALAKVGIQKTDLNAIDKDKKPMKKALAFCQNIRTSELFSSSFSSVVEDYISNENISPENKTNLKVELFHVDGTFNAEQRNEKLDWLKDETDENICRVLTNARCLSEGVDVPSLDAIMFLHPRRSQIDVVQSVGRVMRKSEGKKLGYVILPITVAPGVSAEKALNDNERYEVVWQILNALRAHDERFDSSINRIRLGEDVSDRIEIVDGTKYPELEATTAVIDDIKPKPTGERLDNEDNNTNLGENNENQNDTSTEFEQLTFTLTDLSQAIKAKIVEKCGTRDYWEKWAKDIAVIAQNHITRIKSIVFDKNSESYIAFDQFFEEIKDDLNPEITETDAVEMLAQHIVTKPVFDALFDGYRFTEENTISIAMEKVLSKIYTTNIRVESQSLIRFYESVQRRSKGISTAKGRQTLLVELYDRFFKNAFPRLAQTLGIVYTPIELVDFINYSVEDILRNEFNSTLSDKNVHLLDPFTGTGTFISRLIQSDIISDESISRKYKEELHANEIVLLASYIASVNIESVYAQRKRNKKYEPFEGLVLTDTFQLFEQEKDLIANLLPDNSQKRTKQKETNIHVIVGNPPYYGGQSSANENAANIKYQNLDERIETTYASKSEAKNKNALYDSYIRAIRWSSDRIKDEGIVAFVTSANWLDARSCDGLRRCIFDEFSKVYIFNLRGNKRTLGEISKMEGGPIFASGSRSPIAINIFVRKKGENKQCEISYHDIGDYLTREKKLELINQYKSLNFLIKEKKFASIYPDKKNDWLNQGDKSFEEFIVLGNKNNDNKLKVFDLYSRGLATGRDSWCVNFSLKTLMNNIENMINFYNEELDRFSNLNLNFKDPNLLDRDNKKISWGRGLIKDFSNRKYKTFKKERFYNYLYRPFTKSYVYFDRDLNDMVYQSYRLFPNAESKNLVIVISGIGSKHGLSVLMSDCLPDLNLLEAGAQYFPLNIPSIEKGNTLFSQLPDLLDKEKCSITQDFYKFCKTFFKNINLNKEDIFYYVYAILHSNEYRSKYKNNLVKELPRIPLVKNTKKLIQLISYGKKLSKLHTGFEEVEKYPIQFSQGDIRLLPIDNPAEFYKLNKMKFEKRGDKSSVVYNKNLTLINIPLEAYQYKICGRPALEWVMDRQGINVDKSSGIKNDSNDYANLTKRNPAYPLELFQRVITISLETIKIVNSLPNLDID